MRLQGGLVCEAAAAIWLGDFVSVPVEHCWGLGSAAEGLPGWRVPAAELAARVLLGRAERQCAIAALVGISWRRWGRHESLSVDVGRWCRGGAGCGRCCLNFWDVVVELLDVIIVDIIVSGVGDRHSVGLKGGADSVGLGNVYDQEDQETSMTRKTG